MPVSLPALGPATTAPPANRPDGTGSAAVAAPAGWSPALPGTGPAPAPARTGGSVPPPAAGAVFLAGLASGGSRRRRVGWALLAGAAVVVVGVAVAVPLWPGGGDAATASKTRAAADVPPTPTPTPVAPVTPRTQINGVRSGAPKPGHSKKPAKGCRDYQHVYTMLGTGTVVLKVSVCRDVFSGTAVLADAAPKDGWDICVQLRGHVAGPGPATYMSTTPMTSHDGRVHSFENGPKVKLGAKTKTTEDSVAVNSGRCRGSGAHIQTSWQDQEKLAAG